MWLWVPLALADTGNVVDGAPPVADAGVGLLAFVGDTVSLNGHGSTDPESAALDYLWRQVGGPEVTLDKRTTPEPEFEVEAPGTLRFELVVNDGTQDSDPSVVAIVVAEQSFIGQPAACAAAGTPGGILAFAAAFAASLRRR